MKYKCIYCGKEKEESEFNREHVLPEAFGKFENNYVLHNIVCEECNQKFGDTFEWILSNDTFEGELRFKYRIRNKYKINKTSKLDIRFNEGYLEGCPAEITIDNKVIPKEGYVGLYNNIKGKYNYIHINDLTERAKIPKEFLNYEQKIYLLFNFDNKKIKNRLIELGYRLDFDNDSKPIHIGKSSDIYFSRILDSDIGRAISKISLNYLTYEYGPEYANYRCFNPIRNFIRYGNGSVNDFVSLRDEPLLKIEKERNQRVFGHLFGIEWLQNGEVIAYITLFNTIIFKVMLTKTSSIFLNKSSCGAFFNLNPERREIVKIKKYNPSSLLESLGFLF